ncbi:ATP-binding cassette domain-containing protein [Mesorhizobium sp. B2-5-3]|nr:ATP-binding cassette domain-containing protein [Mesorhizobium sp. B2-5-3]
MSLPCSVPDQIHGTGAGQFCSRGLKVLRGTLIMTLEIAPTTLATLQVPTAQGAVLINVDRGKPVFILGRNGTGKSALVHMLANQLGNRVVYVPGSRPSYFDSESLTLTPASLRDLTSNLRSWDSSPDTRWKPISGTARNEKAIHDLQAAEVQYKVDAANEITRDGTGSTAISRLQSHNSPLDRVNALLKQANLPTRVVIADGELKTDRAGQVYSIAKMSDGERTALIIAAEVVSASSDTIFLIDEPELHLHRSIVVPLLAALMAEKPDAGFVVSTHELELPAESVSARVVLVRGCQWQGKAIGSWDVDVLPDASEIPEPLRVDILGSRRKILFIEGTSTSLDQPLYALLFPNVSISSRDGSREVMRAVAGLRATEAVHHATGFGLVDNDGMGADRIAKLQAEYIYPLSIFAVESLYYSNEVLVAVASQQSMTLGTEAEALLADARSQALTSLNLAGKVEHLASRVSERQMRDTVLRALPDRQAVIDGNTAPLTISITSPYPTELSRLRELLRAGDLDGIIARYPVRESGVLDGIARGLRFRDRADYEKAALTRIGAEDPLKAALRQKLEPLTPQLL